MPNRHYTLVCGFEVTPGEKCGRVIAQSRPTEKTPYGSYRPVRWGRCWLHRPAHRWDHRLAPITMALLLFASPAFAQARFVSDAAVWTAIGMDTVASARADDRRAAFQCQALRMVTTAGAAEAAKRIVGKERPDKSDRKSFYSMHTAMAGQAAGWRYQVGIPLTMLTGVGRVHAKRHDWIDVIVGGLAGLAASKLCQGER